MRPEFEFQLNRRFAPPVLPCTILLSYKLDGTWDNFAIFSWLFQISPSLFKIPFPTILLTQFPYKELERTHKQTLEFKPSSISSPSSSLIAKFMRRDWNHHTHYYLQSFSVNWSMGTIGASPNLPRKLGDCNWRLN